MSVRLNNLDVVPSKYLLKTWVDLDQWQYWCEEIITLSALPISTSTHVGGSDSRQGDAMESMVTLHAAPSIELDISSIQGGRLVERDAEKSLIVFAVPKVASDASERDVTLELSFRFKHFMQQDQRGFYRVEYTDDTSGGQIRRMAATHFEPIGARRFFVCLDEPAARADFELTVLVPEKREATHSGGPLTVLSNGSLLRMEATHSSDEATHLKDISDTWMAHVFASVPKVPPYLCAVVIGEMEHIEQSMLQNQNDGSTKRVPVRVYTTKGKSHLGQFTLDAAVFSLKAFEQLFGCPYPLPKLDLVAIPEFPIGGMENWGCICLVESTLLDPRTAPLQSLKGCSNLVCHEVSHNWFGNLVGIDWWEGLWLKEGFASWCGYYATDLWHPEWHVMEDAVGDVTDALRVDQFQGSHPVEVAILDPSLITQVFDSISYDKGMAVVMMLRTFLGAEDFETGIQAYMKRYAYRSTTTTQLWEAMEEATGRPVASLMGGFTKAVGFPLLSVDLLTSDGDSTGDGQNTRIRCSQCRCVTAAADAYYKSSPSGSGGAFVSEIANVWTIPLVIRCGIPSTDHVAEHVTQLAQAQQDIEVLSGGNIPLKVNPLQTGFFRCRYSAALMKDLLQHFGKLPYQDRRGIISDVFSLLDSDADVSAVVLHDLVNLMDLTAHHETDTAVLQAYFSCVEHLAEAFRGDAPQKICNGLEELLLETAIGFTLPLARDMIQLSGDAIRSLTPAEAKRRSMILAQALTLLRTRREADSEITHYAIGVAKRFLESTTHDAGPDPDILLPCLLTAITFAEDHVVLQASMTAKLESLKGHALLSRSLLAAMGRLPIPSFVEQLLITSTLGTSTLIRAQFGHILFAAAADNTAFREALWPFFQRNFDQIARQWGGGQFRIQAIVDSVGRSVSLRSDPPSEAADSAVIVARFREFFVQHPLPNASLVVDRAAEYLLLKHQQQTSLGPKLMRLLAKRK